MVLIFTEWWCTEAKEATQTHSYNPVATAYPVWAYYAHGRQRRCQEDPVGLSSGRLEKTTRLSPHHVAQPTGSETTPPYAPRSSRFGSEPPSAEDDVDVWRYAIVSCMPETTTTGGRRLTRPSWLVTYRDGLPVHRRSPILVLTGSDVAQLGWSRPTHYH